MTAASAPANAAPEITRPLTAPAVATAPAAVVVSELMATPVPAASVLTAVVAAAVGADVVKVALLASPVAVAVPRIVPVEPEAAPEPPLWPGDWLPSAWAASLVKASRVLSPVWLLRESQ